MATKKKALKAPAALTGQERRTLSKILQKARAHQQFYRDGGKLKKTR